jgi:hypothetical protein
MNQDTPPGCRSGGCNRHVPSRPARKARDRRGGSTWTDSGEDTIGSVTGALLGD